MKLGKKISNINSFDKIESIWEMIFLIKMQKLLINLTLRISQNIEADIGEEINNEIIQTLIKHERIRRTNKH